jgi:hypothetical protein
VPLIAVGRVAPGHGAQPGRFQQVDLIPSLSALIGDHACRTAWQGRFLGPAPRPARFAIAPDPAQRDRVSVIEGATEYRMILDGDRTRWQAPPPDAAAAAELIDHVNGERISRMPEFAQASQGAAASLSR